MNGQTSFPRVAMKLFLASAVIAGQALPAGWVSLERNASTWKNQPKPSVVSIASFDHSGNILKNADVEKVEHLTVSVTIPGIELSDRTFGNEVFQSIHVPGIPAYTVDAGKPAVPVEILMLEIPFNSQPEIIIESVMEHVLDNLNLLPNKLSQKENSTNKRVGSTDDTTYGGIRLYPEDNLIRAETITLRNHRFVRIELALARFRPVSREVLMVCSLALKIQLSPSGPENSSLDGAASRSLDRLFSSTGYSSRLPDANRGGAPEKYMILMNDRFASNAALDTFITWKRRKGYDVSVVKTSAINRNGHPDSSEIRSYLSGLSSVNYPAYLLIIGDETAENGVDGWGMPGTQNASDGYYSDLYYASKKPAGEFPAPDLFYGRLPAVNNDELTTMLTKAVAMDRTPPLRPMYDNIVVAGCLQNTADPDNELPDNVEDERYGETADAVACFFEQDAGGIDYTCSRSMQYYGNGDVDAATGWNDEYSILWNPGIPIGSRVFDRFMPPWPSQEATSKVITAIENGCALVYQRSHGGIDNWATPLFTSSDAANLSNEENPTLVWSISSLTGAYHRHLTNIPRALILIRNGGAYAVVAAGSESLTKGNDWMSHGMFTGLLGNYVSWHNTSTTPDWSKNLPEPSGMIAGSACKLGTNLNFGKTYMLQNYAGIDTARMQFEVYHLFGDPEGEIVLHTPQPQAVTHPPVIPTGSHTVEVRTGSNDAVQVCLYSEPLGIHQVATAQGGLAVFDVFCPTAGAIHVTVTGFGKLPYEGVISAATRSMRVFGCEDASAWHLTAGSGTLFVDTLHKTQGYGSLGVGGSGNREITSIPMRTAAITGKTATLALDIFIGSIQPSPSSIGQIELFISCPSAGFSHLHVGSAAVSGLSLPVFNQVIFTLSDAALGVLRGNYSDVTISLALTAGAVSQIYYIDNLQFLR